MSHWAEVLGVIHYGEEGLIPDISPPRGSEGLLEGVRNGPVVTVYGSIRSVEESGVVMEYFRSAAFADEDARVVLRVRVAGKDTILTKWDYVPWKQVDINGKGE